MDAEHDKNCPFHRLIRLPEVLRMTGLSRSVLLGLGKKGRISLIGPDQRQVRGLVGV